MPVPSSPRLLTWGPNALPVPYVAPWSGERPTTASLTVRADGKGLAYADQRRGDRDRHGVLWARLGEAPGGGRPNYRAQHGRRQRLAMLHRLCQVCGGPADRNGKGWLFLLERPTAEDPTALDPAAGSPAAGGPAGWPEGGLSTKPPVCLPCAGLALRHCPHLTDPLLVRCRKPRPWGVFGGFFLPAPGGGGLTASGDAHLPYGHPGTPWFLASQAVTELIRCIVTSRDAERIPG
jgi:hypothetical protein